MTVHFNSYGSLENGKLNTIISKSGDNLSRTLEDKTLSPEEQNLLSL